jgi:hypothetical protein
MRLVQKKTVAQNAPRTPADGVVPRLWLEMLRDLRGKPIKTVRDFYRHLAGLEYPSRARATANPAGSPGGAAPSPSSTPSAVISRCENKVGHFKAAPPPHLSHIEQSAVPEGSWLPCAPSRRRKVAFRKRRSSNQEVRFGAGSEHKTRSTETGPFAIQRW